MKALLRTTTAYKAFLSARGAGQSVLAVFPDGKYLRALLKECAKAYFGAEDGSRVAELIDKESYADCLFFPAAGEKLTADDCAHIVEESQLLPVEGEKKLFVLDNFHTATPLVQNKLLKSLEEPPEGVSFLLGAESEYPVLPTVLSRVKKYAAAPFSEEQIEGALARAYGRSEETSSAAWASGGIYSVGEAVYSGGGEAFRLAEEFLRLGAKETFCRRMADYKEKREFFAAVKSLLRDALFLSAGQGRFVRRKSAEQIAENYPRGALIAALELVCAAEQQIQFNANFAACLFTLARGIEEERNKWQRLS